MKKKMMIAPSILNADNLNLGRDIKYAIQAGIERFHIDIMDAHFVPNLSYGPELVADFKREFPLIQAEVHLMSNNLSDLVPLFVQAGADLIELHYESASPQQLHHWFDYLAANQVKAGLVLNPETPLTVIDDFLNQINQVLLMTVHPGFGGQHYLETSNGRIAEVAKKLQERASVYDLEVDGGINAQTAESARQSGATVFVAGSYIFGNKEIASPIRTLESVLNQ